MTSWAVVWDSRVSRQNLTQFRRSLLKKPILRGKRTALQFIYYVIYYEKSWTWAGIVFLLLLLFHFLSSYYFFIVVLLSLVSRNAGPPYLGFFFFVVFKFFVFHCSWFQTVVFCGAFFLVVCRFVMTFVKKWVSYYPAFLDISKLSTHKATVARTKSLVCFHGI